MQPYFLPYVGYFNLISAVDHFVVYDEIKYTKKGWINRNRIQDSSSEIRVISLPLKSDSDFLPISKRFLSSDFDKEKLLRQISSAYRHASCYEYGMKIVETLFSSEDTNLFRFLYSSLNLIINELEIETQLHISSQIETSTDLFGEERVIGICKDIGATTYINPPGGVDLYSDANFQQNQLELLFVSPHLSEYSSVTQFVPGLSIIDLLMNVGKSETRSHVVNDYSLLTSEKLKSSRIEL